MWILGLDRRYHHLDLRMSHPQDLLCHLPSLVVLIVILYLPLSPLQGISYPLIPTLRRSCSDAEHLMCYAPWLASHNRSPLVTTTYFPRSQPCLDMMYLLYVEAMYIVSLPLCILRSIYVSYPLCSTMTTTVDTMYPSMNPSIHESIHPSYHLCLHLYLPSVHLLHLGCLTPSPPLYT